MQQERDPARDLTPLPLTRHSHIRSAPQRRVISSHPSNVPPACSPPARGPFSLPGLCPQGILLQHHPEQDNRSHLRKLPTCTLGERVCKRSRRSLRNTPWQTEPKEITALVWPTWTRCHPAASSCCKHPAGVGSLKETRLNWVLLETKNGLWGGGYIPYLLSSHADHKNLDLPISEDLPAFSSLETPAGQRQRAN